MFDHFTLLCIYLPSHNGSKIRKKSYSGPPGKSPQFRQSWKSMFFKLFSEWNNHKETCGMKIFFWKMWIFLWGDRVNTFVLYYFSIFRAVWRLNTTLYNFAKKQPLFCNLFMALKNTLVSESNRQTIRKKTKPTKSKIMTFFVPSFFTQKT